MLRCNKGYFFKRMWYYILAMITSLYSFTVFELVYMKVENRNNIFLVVSRGNLSSTLMQL